MDDDAVTARGGTPTTPGAGPTGTTVARLGPLTVVPVWVLTLVLAVVVVATASRDAAYTWLPLALAASIVVTFVLQLATSQKDGLVSRTIVSTCGSLVILAVATLVVELR